MPLYQLSRMHFKRIQLTFDPFELKKKMLNNILLLLKLSIQLAFCSLNAWPLITAHGLMFPKSNTIKTT